MTSAPDLFADPSAPGFAARCPLCGTANRCAVETARETGEKQPPCWCMTADFDPAALERIPEAARNRACICEACATGKAPA